MPKVSVLMPVYRTDESYLRQAIESILNQTFTDFEFLILDDCPEDDREKVVKSYQDNRIKYFKNNVNMGITPSRNRLIDWAQGEYIAIFDHDDISLPMRLEKQVAYLECHHDIGVVGSQVKAIIRQKTTDYPVHDKDIKLALMRACVIAHSASMIRKSVLMDYVIRYEESFSPAEDYALWGRLIPVTAFYNIDEVLLYYRDHHENTTHKQSHKMRQATYAVWSFVQTQNAELYTEFLLKAKQIKQTKLFGFIPLLKSVSKGTKCNVYLFEKIPLYTTKTKIKL